MNLLHALVLAVLQGATELFPVSSLGHAVVVPALLHWPIDRSTRLFLPFLVMLHVGTATALLTFFWRDWITIARGVLGFGGPAMRREGWRVFRLVVIATIPAVIVGFVLERRLRGLFGAPMVAAIFLVVNAVFLFAGERLRGHGGRALSGFTWKDALIVGCFQCLALIPGISRSGATMVGGLARGVDHEDAAHFSFLIATPVIAGAAVLEVPKLLHHGALGGGAFGIAALAAVVAGVTAYASTAFLMRWFRSHEKWALDPFAWYCVAVGLGSIALLAIGG